MKKVKIVSLLLALAMVFALSACGGGGGGQPGGSTPPPATQPAGEPTGGGAAAKPPVDVIKIGIVNPTTGPLAGLENREKTNKI